MWPESGKAEIACRREVSNEVSSPCENGDEADHNIETGYLFLMGYYFRADPRYLAIGTQLIRHKTTRMHPRQFNWVYRASPQAIWFLKESGIQPADLTKFNVAPIK